VGVKQLTKPRILRNNVSKFVTDTDEGVIPHVILSLVNIDLNRFVGIHLLQFGTKKNNILDNLQ
jgi:hypothetical protein